MTTEIAYTRSPASTDTWRIIGSFDCLAEERTAVPHELHEPVPTLNDKGMHVDPEGRTWTAFTLLDDDAIAYHHGLALVTTEQLPEGEEDPLYAAWSWGVRHDGAVHFVPGWRIYDYEGDREQIRGSVFG